MGCHTVGTKATSKNPPQKIKKNTSCNTHFQAMAKNASVVASKQAPTFHPGPLLYEQGSYFDLLLLRASSSKASLTSH
jgi:hypothetical protein